VYFCRLSGSYISAAALIAETAASLNSTMSTSSRLSALASLKAKRAGGFSSIVKSSIYSRVLNGMRTQDNGPLTFLDVFGGRGLYQLADSDPVNRLVAKHWWSHGQRSICRACAQSQRLRTFLLLLSRSVDAKAAEIRRVGALGRCEHDGARASP